MSSLEVLVASIRELNAHLPRQQQIRINSWIKKLLEQKPTNVVWQKSTREYAEFLLLMLHENNIEPPFSKMPPTGPLPLLPRYVISRIEHARCTMLKQQARCKSTLTRHKKNPFVVNQCTWMVHDDDQRQQDDDDDAQVRRPVVCNQQSQTKEETDQYEWQRLWKHAFQKLQVQLQAKTKAVDQLQTQVQELTSVVHALQTKLDSQTQQQQELEQRHRAHMQNLTSVHDKEVSQLQRSMRQKMEALRSENEYLQERLRSERKINLASATAAATAAMAASASSSASRAFLNSPATASSQTPQQQHADFLEYIDHFHEDTVGLLTTSS